MKQCGGCAHWAHGWVQGADIATPVGTINEGVCVNAYSSYHNQLMRRGDGCTKFKAATDGKR